MTRRSILAASVVFALAPAAVAGVAGVACSGTSKAPVAAEPELPDGAADPALAGRIDEIAAAALAEGPAAGMSIAILRDGKVILARGYGYTDLAAHAVAGPDTVYRLGSITKQ